MNTQDTINEMNVSTVTLEVQETAHLSFGQTLVHGMGGFLSLGGIVIVALAIGALSWGIDEMAYSANAEEGPRAITTAEGGDVSDGDHVALTGALDYTKYMQFESLRGESFQIVPVAGSDFRLFVAEPGLVVPEEPIKQGVHTGRVTEKDGSFWSVNGQDVDLKYQFRKHDIEVPDDARIILLGAEPDDSHWPLFSAIGGCLVLLLLGCRIAKTATMVLAR